MLWKLSTWSILYAIFRRMCACYCTVENCWWYQIFIYSEIIVVFQCVIAQALNKLSLLSVCLIYLDSDTPLQMCTSPHSLFSGVCVCLFLCPCLLPQTRCLISLGWVTWRSTPGRMPRSSVLPRAKSPRVSPSSSRWERVVFFIIFVPDSHSAPVHLDNEIGLEIALKEEEATKRIKRNGFTCLALSWQSYPGRAYSRIICMLGCWPNSYVSFI